MRTQLNITIDDLIDSELQHFAILPEYSYVNPINSMITTIEPAVPQGYFHRLAFIREFMSARTAYLWNAAGGVTGTFVWLLFYYAFVEIQKSVTMSPAVSGVSYTANCLAQGYFANRAAKPFIKRACLADGESEEEATASAKGYLKTYTPIDAQFAANLDLVMALVSLIKKGQFKFIMEADPEFTALEIGLMACATLFLTSTTHLVMNKLVFNKVDLLESYFKIFILTMTFYFTDAAFNVDMQTGLSILTGTLPQLMGSLAMMGVAYVLLDLVCEPLENWFERRNQSKATVEDLSEVLVEAYASDDDLRLTTPSSAFK